MEDMYSLQLVIHISRGKTEDMYSLQLVIHISRSPLNITTAINSNKYNIYTTFKTLWHYRDNSECIFTSSSPSETGYTSIVGGWPAEGG